MRREGLAVAFEGCGAQGVVDVRGLRLEERAHGCLGVDDELAVAGQVDDDVRADGAAFVVVSAPLLVEVAAVEHAGEFEDAAQLGLSPLPAHARGVERAGERRRLAPQQLRAGSHVLERDVDVAVLLHAVTFERCHLVFDTGQGVAQRQQRGGRLGVVAHGGFEVDDAFAQHVTLGTDGGKVVAGAPRGDQRGEAPGDDGAERQPEGEQGDGEKRGHAFTMAWATDNPGTTGISVAPRVSGVRG